MLLSVLTWHALLGGSEVVETALPDTHISAYPARYKCNYYSNTEFDLPGFECECATLQLHHHRKATSWMGPCTCPQTAATLPCRVSLMTYGRGSRSVVRTGQLTVWLAIERVGVAAEHRQQLAHAQGAKG